MQGKQIACLGLSHHTAPVELRERLCCSLASLEPIRGGGNDLARFGSVGEVALLSTCNRVELYAVVSAENDARQLLVDMLAQVPGVAISVFDNYLYYHTGAEAVDHLCRVACGLDSLVLGEQQILGQVGECHHKAIELGTTGTLLSAAFRTAIRAGKRARTETGISSNPVSVSSIAISYAQDLLGDLSERNVLVVGLGEMGLLSLKALRARGIDNVAVANRTVARAQAIADERGLRCYGLDALPQALADSDVVITATRSSEPVIESATVREAMQLRGDHELVLIDIAVPRDIDNAVKDIPNVHLFDTDDLHGTLDEALLARRKEIPAVEEIIAEEITSLRNELQELRVRPLISDLRQKAESIRQRELERTFRHLRDVDPETLERIQHFSRALVNKLLHEPTTRLKEEANNGRSDDYLSAIRELFGLPEDSQGALS